MICLLVQNCRCPPCTAHSAELFLHTPLHGFQPSHHVQVRFIVMNNVFQGALPVGRQYDLKGSTLGRTSGADAAKTGTVLKDLDLDITLKLEEGWHDRCTLL